MKHILFYTDTPGFGGAEKHMILLAKYLRRLGYKVSLAYGHYGRIYRKRAVFEKWCDNVYTLKTSNKHDIRHYFELRKLFKKEKFDLLHIHLWNPGACRYAFFAASFFRIPIVTTEHDPFELSGLKKVIKKMCLRRTKQTIAVSSHNKKLMQELYGLADKKISLVFNGIEIHKFLNNTQKATLPVKKGDMVITCIGEMHPRKGHKYLLEAFAKLETQYPSLQLILVGNGPIESELRKKYAHFESIHFLGWREDVRQILKSSDILVLPSLKEAFGQVLLEAMASGTFVIATNNGGTIDIIRHGKTGILIPPQNTDRIVEAIKIVINNPAQKKDVERAALQWVKNSFTAEAMAENTLNVYKKIWNPEAKS
jgi:glycosyltransferase involved in cell wall biosynthesis